MEPPPLRVTTAAEFNDCHTADDCKHDEVNQERVYHGFLHSSAVIGYRSPPSWEPQQSHGDHENPREPLCSSATMSCSPPSAISHHREPCTAPKKSHVSFDTIHRELIRSGRVSSPSGVSPLATSIRQSAHAIRGVVSII